VNSKCHTAVQNSRLKERSYAGQVYTQVILQKGFGEYSLKSPYYLSSDSSNVIRNCKDKPSNLMFCNQVVMQYDMRVTAYTHTHDVAEESHDILSEVTH
jgi:hypothetical protein